MTGRQTPTPKWAAYYGAFQRGEECRAEPSVRRKLLAGTRRWRRCERIGASHVQTSYLSWNMKTLKILCILTSEPSVSFSLMNPIYWTRSKRLRENRTQPSTRSKSRSDLSLICTVLSDSNE